MAVNIGPKIGIDGEAEYRAQINNIIQQAKTLGSEMKVVSATYEKSGNAAEKAAETAKVYVKQIENQKDRVKLLQDMLDKSADKYGENDNRTLKWKQALNEANAELRKMENQLGDTVDDLDHFGKMAEKAKDGLGKLGNAMKTGLTAAAKAGAAAISAAGTAIIGLGKIGLEYNNQMESYTANFAVMLGSQEAAVNKVESLKKMAASTPFEMAGLADATQQLLAFGVANEDTNMYLQQLGDISLGDADKMNSLVAAFGKMNSTGKVTLEYINMMAEQGFNPLNIIAQQTGETMEELYARLSKGGVSFDEITNAMKIATSEGGQFYKGMETASKTTQGMISTLKDNATALIGEVFKPISNSLKDELLPAAIDSIERLSTAFEEDGVEGMISAAGEIIAETIGTFTKKLPEFAKSATSMVKSLLKGISDNSKAITSGAADTVEVLIEGLLEMLPDIVETGLDLLLGLAEGLVKATPNLIAKIPEIIEKIIKAFTDRAGDFLELGKNIIMGVWEGIKSLGTWLSDKIRGLLGGTVSASKKELGIHSPSKVFAEIGENMALGVGAGWKNTFGSVSKGITKTLDFGATAANRMINPAAGGRSVSLGGVEIKVYGAQGQDVNQLADVVMQKLERAVRKKEAVFGV